MNELARSFSALTTDLYEITMACGYWKAGVSNHEGAFHVTFRKNPFCGEFTIACGLAQVVDLVRGFRFQENELAYLSEQRGNDGKPLFDHGFLDHLRTLRLTCDIDALLEGTLVFPNEPLLRITGSIIQCQLLETALLTILNFQSLIATKAARVCLAAQGDPVIEFGLRRAQGVDGGLSAARAAYIGGSAGTSNVHAGERFGIPVSGTQAHSWIMFFETEREAFEAYARAMPNNCVFLVDTYNSIDGIRHAIDAARKLRSNGHEMIGVRLDSGDCVALSIEARRVLDEAGFADAKIVCSGDLDEFAIAELKQRGAKIDIWGVGTKMTTGQPDAALGGVYKLAAVRGPGGNWRHRIKLSDDPAKTSCPGRLQVRRFCDPDGKLIGDAIYEIDRPPGNPCVVVDLVSNEQSTISDVGEGDSESFHEPGSFPKNQSLAATFNDLLVPIFRRGELIYDLPALDAARDRVRQQLSSLPPEATRLKDPRRYPVGLESSLQELRSTLIARATQQAM